MSWVAARGLHASGNSVTVTITVTVTVTATVTAPPPPLGKTKAMRNLCFAGPALPCTLNPATLRLCTSISETLHCNEMYLRPGKNLYALVGWVHAARGVGGGAAESGERRRPCSGRRLHRRAQAIKNSAPLAY